ncbi:HAD family hydrolase [Leucothrix sargassi]|nr:HAD family hydrolase [Leucothrix sargassi]
MQNTALLCALKCGILHFYAHKSVLEHVEAASNLKEGLVKDNTVDDRSIILITTLIFDLDLTLVDRTATVHKFLQEQYDRFSEQLTCSKEAYIEKVMLYQENGYADKLVAYQRTFEELEQVVDAEVFLDDFKNVYGRDAVLFPNITTMLADVATRYRLAILSNGRSKAQNAKIDNCGIREFFEVIVISEEEGVAKPDVEIYQRCLSKLGAEAAECLFIGDNAHNDITVPKQLGMATAWVQSPNYDAPEAADIILESAADIVEHLNS